MMVTDSRAALIMLAMILIPVDLAAQGIGVKEVNDTGGPPRPNAVHDHVFEFNPDLYHTKCTARRDENYESGGYPVYVYFQNMNEKNSRGTSHVFHTPVLYLMTNADGSIKRNIYVREESFELQMYVYSKTNSASLHKAIREELKCQAKKEDDTAQFGVLYNINPLTMTRSWFEFGRKPDGSPRFESVSMASKDFLHKGPHTIHFFSDTQEKLLILIDELQARNSNLVYRYTFSGISIDPCTVSFKKNEIQIVDRLKDLEGESKDSEGYVTRKQVAKIANQIEKTGHLTASCNDWKMGGWIIDKLMESLEQSSKAVETVPWEKFFEVNGDDLKPDIEKVVTNMNQSVERKSTDESTINSGGKTYGATVEAGGISLLGAASGSASFSSAKDFLDLKNNISNVLKKHGAQGKWHGIRYKPKSVKVYNKNELAKIWGEDLKYEYKHRRKKESTNTILITAREVAPWKALNYMERLARDMRDYVHNEVRQTNNLAYDAMEKAEAAESAAQSVQVDIQNAMQILRQRLGNSR